MNPGGSAAAAIMVPTVASQHASITNATSSSFDVIYENDNNNISFHQSVQSMIPLVAKLRQLVATETDPSVHYELEARFGQCEPYIYHPYAQNQQQYSSNYHHPLSNGALMNFRFHAGVPNIFMDKIMKDLASYDGWYHTTSFDEMQDFTYPVQGLGSVRTTVQYNESLQGSSGPLLRQRHIHKQRIDSVLLRLQMLDMNSNNNTTTPFFSEMCDNVRTDTPSAQFGASAGTFLDPVMASSLMFLGVRIDLNREQEIAEKDPRLPWLQNTTHMRIKQRKSYTYASDNAEKPTWQFDLTFSWSGTTKTEAEQKQRNTPPTCEVECELLNPRYALIDQGRDDEYIAESLLCKMTDFIPLSEPQFKWLPVGPGTHINNNNNNG